MTPAVANALSGLPLGKKAASATEQGRVLRRGLLRHNLWGLDLGIFRSRAPAVVAVSNLSLMIPSLTRP